MGNSKSNFNPASLFCLVILSWIIFFNVPSYTCLSFDIAPKSGIMFNVQLLKLNRSHCGSEEDGCNSFFELLPNLLPDQLVALAFPRSINGLFVQ